MLRIKLRYFLAWGVVLILAALALTRPYASPQRWRGFHEHALDTELQVAYGNFTDVIALHKFGRNPDVDNQAAEDVWTVGGAYVFPSVAEVVEVVSTDADDTGDGTGARTLSVLGLDESYVEVEETVTLDGLTPVTTTQTFLRVFRAYVLTVGATGTNEGDINASNAGLSLFSLAAGKGQTTLGLYTVPEGKSLLVTRIFGSINMQANGAATLEFVIRPEGGAFRTVFYAGMHSQGDTRTNTVPMPPYMIPARTDIKLRVIVSANNTDVDGGFDGYLVTR